MTHKPNTALIGAFIVAGFILIMAGIITFGSGKLLLKTNTYVLYFDDPIQGLERGASVYFEGVRVGTVKEILVFYDLESKNIRIPVYVYIETERFNSLVPKIKGKKKETGDLMQNFTNMGLRAELSMDNLLTGKKIISLSFQPNNEVALKGVDEKYIEIPTIPSRFTGIADTLEKYKIQDIVEEIGDTIVHINNIVKSPETEQIITDLQTTISELRHIIHEINQDIEPLLNNVDSASAAASSTFTQAEKVMNKIDTILKDDSPTLNYNLNNTLKELEEVSRSIRVLIDYLQEQPSSVIWGKPRE